MIESKHASCTIEKIKKKVHSLPRMLGCGMISGQLSNSLLHGFST